MTISNNKNNRKTSKAFIFRSRNNTRKSTNRQLLEAFLLLFVGVCLIIFLHTLPQDFLLIRLSGSIWNELWQSLLLLANSLANIAVAFIVILLLVISLIFILAAVSRLIIIVNRKKALKRK